MTSGSTEFPGGHSQLYVKTNVLNNIVLCANRPQKRDSRRFLSKWVVGMHVLIKIVLSLAILDKRKNEKKTERKKKRIQ